MPTITEIRAQEGQRRLRPGGGQLGPSRPGPVDSDRAHAAGGRGLQDHYATQFGHSLDGLDWWLDQNPEVLKRYRLYSSLTLRVEPAMTGNGTLTFYMLRGVRHRRPLRPAQLAQPRASARRRRWR